MEIKIFETENGIEYNYSNDTHELRQVKTGSMKFLEVSRKESDHVIIIDPNSEEAKQIIIEFHNQKIKQEIY